MAGAGMVHFDVDAVGSASSGIQAVSRQMSGLQVRCKNHQSHASGLLDELRQMVNVALESVDWGLLWDQLGFGALLADLEATREILSQQLSTVQAIHSLLDETHAGILAQRLDDELSPLSEQIQACHNHLDSTKGSVVVENLLPMFLGAIDLPMMIGVTIGELLAIEDEADTVYNVLCWLAQAEYDLIHLQDSPFRDLWLHAFDGSSATTNQAMAVQQTQPNMLDGQMSATTTGDQVAAEAQSIAGQLGLNGNVYNILKSNDPKLLAVLRLDPKDWSTTDVECVAFVWLAYSSIFPVDKMSTMLHPGYAGNDFWNAYNTKAAYAQGWRVIPNGQPPQHPQAPQLQNTQSPQFQDAQSLQSQSQQVQPTQLQSTELATNLQPPLQPPSNGPHKGDILVIQFTDGSGHDRHLDGGTYGHVAIITNVSYNAQMNPTSFTIVQSNTQGVKGAPAAYPTQATIQVDPATGQASMPTWLGNGRILGYVRYAPGTP